MWSNERNSLSARVTVLGCSGVGKTALVVRYLTKRYIGDYISGTDITYKCELSFMRRQIEVQIVDTSGQTSKEMILDIAKCCRSENDVLMLVYAMNDVSSFHFIEEILPEVTEVAPRASLLVIGNKSDLDQSGNLFEDSMRLLAKQHAFSHMTVSAKSSCGDATRIFSKSVSLLIKKRSLATSASSTDLTIQDDNQEKHDFRFSSGSRRRRFVSGAKLTRRATVDSGLAERCTRRLERRGSERLPSVEEDTIIEEIEAKSLSDEISTDDSAVSNPPSFRSFSSKKRKKLPPVSIPPLSPTSDDSSGTTDSLVPKSAPLPTNQMPVFRFPEVSCAAEYRHASLPTSPDHGLKRNNSFLNKIKGALTAVPQRLRSPK